MEWKHTGNGVYVSDNECYVVSRLPGHNGKKFILMRRQGGKIGEGTLKMCKALANTDMQPYHNQLAQLAKRGVMSLGAFAAAFAS